MRVVEIEPGLLDWDHLIDGEPQPWGGVGEDLSWQPKTHAIALLDDNGTVIATGGAVIADVRAGEARFQVAGIGGVFVTRRARGRGHTRPLMERLLQIAGRLGPERAMLLCLPSRIALYERFGFAELDGRIRATQPGGPVTVPMRGMWRPLSPGIHWPPGEIELLGEPL